MSLTLSYPGVYVTEVPSGSRTLTGVATSITAFVGRTLAGPVDEPIQIENFAEYERTFGGLWRLSGLSYAVRQFYLNGGGTALVVRVASGAVTAELDLGTLTLSAIGPGIQANSMSVTVTHPDPSDAAEIATSQGGDITADDLFNLEIRADQDSPVADETFLNLTVKEGPRQVDLVLLGSRFLRASGLGATAPAATVYPVTTDGTDGAVPDTDDYAGTGFEAAKRGLYALEKADLFNILVLPPSAPDGDAPDDLWVSALAYCRRRRAFLVVDPPQASTLDTVKTWAGGTAGLAGTDTRNAALYFPRIRSADPLRGGASADFAAAGAVAGIMARTDAGRGVWKAPAGIEAGINGAGGVSLPLTDGENGQLNPIGINCLRSFRIIGPVVWGARTLRGADVLADEYKYVPVRRFALFLEESLYRGTQWVVFEPNDRPLWSQIRASIGAFMQDLFRQGAFQGATPRDAYFVRCDEETTTQYDIDRGIVNINVGFAPLKPAEFVVISVQQKTAEAGA